MKKAVAIIAQYPELEQLVKTLDEIEDHYEQKQEFLVKQAKDLKKEREMRSQPVMNGVLSLLRDKHLLPADYDETKHHLHIDEAGAIMVCDGEHSKHPVLQFLSGMGITPESMD